MSCSYHVAALRDKDAKHEKLVALWKQCLELNIVPPKEVKEYFQECYIVADADLALRCSIGSAVSGDVNGAGMIIDLAKLPKETKRLIVYASC